MKLTPRRKAIREAEEAVDTSSEKRDRGRPQTIPRSWVIGRADNYRTMLKQAWASLASPLLAADSEEQVRAAFEEHGKLYAREFVPQFAADILGLVHDPRFPRRPKSRIGFLGDSLGGRPTVAARTSRDICSKERAQQRAQSPHRIIRHEFYIECECGYKGPARDNACRKCGAEIPVSLWGNSGSLT